MRFRYSTLDPNQNEFDSLPRVPLTLRNGDRSLEVFGLVDSGATICVLPYHIGIELGALWSDRQATLQLAGNLGQASAMPLVLAGEIEGLVPVNLAFAWSSSDRVPIILGQTNFFMAFEICFYRDRGEFEIYPKSR